MLALVPGTLLANSAVVPTQARYLPAAVLIIALVVACRSDVRTLPARAANLPTWLGRVVAGYALWLVVTTITSTEPVLSILYLVGTLVILGIAFLLVPSLDDRPRLIMELASTLVLTAVFMLVSEALLALAGSLTLFGKSVGVYYLVEATLLGKPIPIILIQDYGPFLGPETTPLALAVVASFYLQLSSSGRARIAWAAAAGVIILGLLATFSREGWLIAAVVCLARSLVGRRALQPALIAGIGLFVMFLVGITNVLGLLGRFDLTNQWYGPRVASVLLNPTALPHEASKQAAWPPIHILAIRPEWFIGRIARFRRPSSAT